MVYFLTEVSENDLLNLTETDGQTLHKNSASMDNGGSVTESTERYSTSRDTNDETRVSTRKETGNAIKPNFQFLGIVGIISVAAVVIIMQVRKKKKEDDGEEEEEEIEAAETIDDDDEEEE